MITVDKIASYIMRGNVNQLVGQYFFWNKNKISSQEEETLKEFEEYATKQVVKDKDLDKLSFPQLIVLYGKIYEKELKPEHLKKVEDLCV